MREILFRGKRLDNGEWVEGYFCNENCDGIAMPTYEQANIIKKGTGFWHHVDPETVGQDTGLTDKNGKKIFEGDFVTIPNSKRQGLPACVRYNKFGATFEIRRIGYNPLSLWCNDLYEVVGNVHDNPELMGGCE